MHFNNVNDLRSYGEHGTVNMIKTIDYTKIILLTETGV